jgi:hypothetical protein
MRRKDVVFRFLDYRSRGLSDEEKWREVVSDRVQVTVPHVPSCPLAVGRLERRYGRWPLAMHNLCMPHQCHTVHKDSSIEAVSKSSASSPRISRAILCLSC